MIIFKHVKTFKRLDSAMQNENDRPVRCVGLTGGTGSGKTVVAGEWKRLGMTVIDADAAAKEIADTDLRVRRSIIKSFDGVFDENGRLNRRLLGKIVFSDPAKLDELNRIIHPSLIRYIRREVKRLSRDHPVCVDMALLFELGLESLFDVVVVVTAPLERRIKWLRTSRGWERKEILGRMNSQLTERERLQRADIIINNNGTLGELRARAREVFNNINNKKQIT
jgi:dephospho-CoA kinase